MATIKYNPLLKRNLQEISDPFDPSAIQAEIDALKITKITKVTAATELTEITDGDIFQWQAASTQQFTQGYFYKKLNNNAYTRVNLQPNYTLPTAAADVLGGVKVGAGLNIDNNGVLSAAAVDSLKIPRCFSQQQINALTDGDIFEWQGETTSDYEQGYFYKKSSNTITFVHTGDLFLYNTVSYLRGNYSITPGYYIGVVWTTENVTGYWINRNSDRTRYYFSFLPAVVGQQALVTNESDGFGDFIEYVTVTAVDPTYGNPTAYSDGVSVSFNRDTPMSSAKFYQFKNTVTNQLAWFAVFQNGNYYYNYACAIIDNGIIYPIGRCNEPITVAQNDITETTILTARVDTQPQPATATTTAAGLMSAADKSKLDGIDAEANKYTLPTATTTVLGGIKVGANLAISNGVLSGNYSNATPERDGLMSADAKVKLDNIDAQFVVYHQFNPLNATTIEDAIKTTVDYFFNANITTNILCYGTMFWQGIYRFEGYMYPYSVGICRFDFIPILNNGVGYVGRYNAGWHFNS